MLCVIYVFFSNFNYSETIYLSSTYVCHTKPFNTPALIQFQTSKLSRLTSSILFSNRSMTKFNTTELL